MQSGVDPPMTWKIIFDTRQVAYVEEMGIAPSEILTDQAEVLLKWARTVLKRPVAKAYVTHFHRDRLGGVPALQQHHIPVFGMQATMDLAAKSGQPVADHLLTLPSTPKLIATDALILFPGAGHTQDNLVVYFPEDHVLFAGCFLKDGNAEGIGNVADADLKAWPESVGRMKRAFPKAKMFIPGHGPMGQTPAERTLELLK
jgi:metallo-beta-lactamase class B